VRLKHLLGLQRLRPQQHQQQQPLGMQLRQRL
jgi:hypothetical protein